jgi:hypothetical protein
MNQLHVINRILKEQTFSSSSTAPSSYSPSQHIPVSLQAYFSLSVRPSDSTTKIKINPVSVEIL